MVSENKKLRLDISGGEPTVREDLPQIISYAAKRGIDVIQIQTNALRLSSRKYTKELKQAGLGKVFAALHSPVSTIHNELVGVKGAFVKCIKGINNALAEGLDVVLNPVVTSKNYKELSEYIEFVKKEFPQLSAISLSVVQPRGRAGNNKDLVPRYKVISPYVQAALQLAKNYKIVVNNPYCGLPLCIGGWYLYLNRCVEYCENITKSQAKPNPPGYSSDKVKSYICCQCDLNDYCNGLWKEYAEMYSFADLRPLRKKGKSFIYR